MDLNFDACYRAILRPLLFQLDAELAHRLTLAVLSRVPALTPPVDPPALRTELFGRVFSNPIGLAGGLDKDGRAIHAWNALGFGFAEIGTVTPKPQPGNSRPRIWRLPKHRAMVNRLGFPSDGMEMVAARLERLNGRALPLRLALNLGPNKETPAERVAEDYAQLMRRLGPLADFIVVNLSSPNTPGLRDFQAPERMRSVVEAIHRAAAGSAQPPLLIKLAPDLEPAMLADICAVALELQLDGIVATNTTLQRDAVGVSSTLMGGLSGEPLKILARAAIARLYRQLGGRIPILGVGGVTTADDAYGHIRAGASLIELYTAMVYRGPGVVRQIKSGLIRLLARDGFRFISEAVGAAPQA
ncbi:MAG TPA: quinone-dependent dihydroorotate dehydrogenase [Candidatus Binataceae bacterium]|nr:quinone-dependent dihydroorotate dehydrogenase [Candidatus Binataceae bacterium]